MTGVIFGALAAGSPRHRFVVVGAGLALAQGDAIRARTTIDRAIRSVELRHDPYALARGLLRRARIALELKDAEQARDDAQRAVELLKKTFAQDAPSGDLGSAYLRIGHALLMMHREQEAAGTLTAAIEQLRPAYGSDHPEVQLATRLLARLEDRRAGHN